MRKCNTGTIKRPFDGNLTLRPLVIQALSKDDSTNEVMVSESKEHAKPNIKVVELGSATPRATKEDMPQGDDNPISSFPPVEEDEIDKHRHLNEEAEKNNSLKPPPHRHQNYLKRLSLEKKTIQDKKTQELKLVKKKILKRVQTKPKFDKEFKDEFCVDKPQTPPKPKEIEAKPMKLILGFRYSYAIEQYYKGQSKYASSEITIPIDDCISEKEELMNGWLVKSLGPTVLNLRARTLPSCNPIELRLRRRQQMRLRDPKRSRGLSRTWSRESGLSRSMLNSRESYSILNPIEEGRESRHSYRSSHEKKVGISQNVDVIGVGEINGRSTMTVLPPICSPNNSRGVPKLKKAISLTLPSIRSGEYV